MLKKILILTITVFSLYACATSGSNNKGVPQDNPMVGSAQASDAEFPAEDQLTPAKNNAAQ